MIKEPPKFHIIEEKENIFDTGEYIIPLYQRAFAWKEDQLNQLIEDIYGIEGDSEYYIGSLIVSKTEDGKYEVVDGQQRLTSLYLLLNCLGIKTKQSLSFACRGKSNYTLTNIDKVRLDSSDKSVPDNMTEPNLKEGISILSAKLCEEKFDKKTFCEKLSKVVIYRIEVPENTDLNRYFEIMNTRGEQLEQHDILKAKLMSYLKDNPADKEMFAKIWEACSDMTGYVQMHFAPAVRGKLFGGDWKSLPSNSWEAYSDILDSGSYENSSSFKIAKIIKEDFAVSDYDDYDDSDSKIRFESVIEFPYFLLHTLRVYVKLNSIVGENPDEEMMGKLLDDQKLVKTFNSVIEKASENGKDKCEFSKEFIMCLLRTRYLLDKYILKREFVNDSSDGEWSLKSLNVSNKKPYYKNSEFKNPGEWNSTNDHRTKTNIMIQSALRVSYTSPKVMHWITELLIWLSENDCEHINNGDLVNYNCIAEKIAGDAVRKNFLDKCKNGHYAMGVDTPHIVFNYLDYLLWNKHRYNKKTNYNDFIFEFRNSVEHWYPRNPIESQGNDVIDDFGNLCIIQRNVNSKFSNLDPESKKINFKDMIENGSIKLRIMSASTETSAEWKDKTREEHEKDMIKILRNACPENEASQDTSAPTVQLL